MHVTFQSLYSFECTFNNAEDVNVVYFENPTFGVIVRWSDRGRSVQHFACDRIFGRSARVGSQKIARGHLRLQ